MPEEITLANVNAAIQEANINTDNHVSEDRYTSELSDIGREVTLMPGKDRKDMHNDYVNGPITLSKNVREQDALQEDIVISGGGVFR